MAEEQQQKGPTPQKSQIITVISLFPIGGFLLLLAGITLTGTIIGITVATPLLIIFSPVIVPAALTFGLALTGFFASGAFGFTAVSSFLWIVDQFKERRVIHTDGQVG